MVKFLNLMVTIRTVGLVVGLLCPNRLWDDLFQVLSNLALKEARDEKGSEQDKPKDFYPFLYSEVDRIDHGGILG